MKLLTFKNFIILSLVVHFFVVGLVSLTNISKHETIVINVENLKVEETSSIDDISDESIFEEMKRMEELTKNETKSATKAKNTINKEIKDQVEKLENLKKEEAKLTKKLASKENEVNKREKIINNLNSKQKILEKNNKNLNEVNEKLEKSIKKKDEKPTKVKPKYTKNKVYKNDLSKYINEIGYRFRKNWIIPVNAEENWSCTVKVKQDNSGKLKNFDILDNCPADPDFLRSIEEAIKESTPLPLPPKNLDFNDIKEITLEFKLQF